MEKSINVLIINSVSVLLRPDFDDSKFFETEIDAEIKYLCPQTGNVFRRLLLKTQARSWNIFDSVKTAAKEFSHGIIEGGAELYDVEFNCKLSKGVNVVEFKFDGEFKKIIEEYIKYEQIL